MTERPAQGDAIEALATDDARTALPLENGELVFQAPWQARVFGMAHGLCDAGLFDWDDFRDHLIAEIARWEAEASPGEAYHYYERFQAALETLLAERGQAPAEALQARATTLAARPHGHDH